MADTFDRIETFESACKKAWDACRQVNCDWNRAAEEAEDWARAYGFCILTGTKLNVVQEVPIPLEAFVPIDERLRESTASTIEGLRALSRAAKQKEVRDAERAEVICLGVLEKRIDVWAVATALRESLPCPIIADGDLFDEDDEAAFEDADRVTDCLKELLVDYDQAIEEHASLLSLVVPPSVLAHWRIVYPEKNWVTPTFLSTDILQRARQDRERQGLPSNWAALIAES